MEVGGGPSSKKRKLDNIREGMKEYNMTEEMAENQSVWNMKTKVGSFLHGGGLVYVNETCGLRTVEKNRDENVKMDHRLSHIILK